MSTYGIVLDSNILFIKINGISDNTLTIRYGDTTIENVPVNQVLFINDGVDTSNYQNHPFVYFSTTINPTSTADLITLDADTLSATSNGKQRLTLKTTAYDVYMCCQGVANESGTLEYKLQYKFIHYTNANTHIMMKLPQVINLDYLNKSSMETNTICCKYNVLYDETISISNQTMITLPNTRDVFGILSPTMFNNQQGYISDADFKYACYVIYADKNENYVIDFMKYYNVIDHANKTINLHVCDYNNAYKAIIHDPVYGVCDVYIVYNRGTTIEFAKPADADENTNLTLYMDDINRYTDGTTTTSNKITVNVYDGFNMNLQANTTYDEQFYNTVQIFTTGINNIKYNNQTITYTAQPWLYRSIQNVVSIVNTRPDLSLLGNTTSIQHNLTTLYNTVGNLIERRLDNITGETVDVGFNVANIDYTTQDVIRILISDTLHAELPSLINIPKHISYNYSAQINTDEDKMITIGDVKYTPLLININNGVFCLRAMFTIDNKTVIAMCYTNNISTAVMHMVDNNNTILEDSLTEANKLVRVNVPTTQLTYENNIVGYFTEPAHMNINGKYHLCYTTTIGENYYFTTLYPYNELTN